MFSSQVDIHKGPECDNCHSKWFYTEDGLEVCRKCGTRQQDRIQVEADEDAYGQGGKITRAQKHESKQPLISYQGRNALELYLQCYQLILWKQSYALIHDKGFPSTIEVVVKDLWALQLQRLQNKIGFVDDDKDGPQLFSSQGETTNTESAESKKPKQLKDFPKLIDSLALCYLAAILLRLPISVGDLYRWVVLEEVPFLRAIRFIPEVMRSKLPAEYASPLDLTSPLRSNDIQDAIRSKLNFYREGFGMDFPKLNYKPLLLKYIENLALPLELFLTTLHLATLLNCSFDFISKFRGKQLIPLPETELLSLLVITVKLFHPFDGLERHVTSITELGFLTVNWDNWHDSQKLYKENRDNDPYVVRSRNVDVKETDIFSLSGSQLDGYLDWYEDTWVEEGRVYAKQRHDLVEQLEALFPIGRPSKSSILQASKERSEPMLQDAILQKLTSNQAHLRLRKVVPKATLIKDKGEQPRRIGSFYKRYRRTEDLPANTKLFYEAAADFACLSLDTLVKAVYSAELALINKRAKDKKNGVDEKNSSEDESEGETEMNFEGDIQARRASDEAKDSEDEMQSDLRDSVQEENEDG